MTENDTLESSRILITGFDAFGEHSLNSSQLVVEGLNDLARPTWIPEILPTSFTRAQHRVLQLLQHHRPRWALHLGLAAGTADLRVEHLAHNLDHSLALDNDGVSRQHAPIVDDGPSSYSTGLPLSPLRQLAHRAGALLEDSRDCGGFVCNHVFFCSAHFFATHHAEGRAGFVHLPPLKANSPELAATVQLLADWLDTFAG